MRFLEELILDTIRKDKRSLQPGREEQMEVDFQETAFSLDFGIPPDVQAILDEAVSTFPPAG